MIFRIFETKPFAAATRIIGSADGPTSIVVASDGMPFRQIIFLALVVILILALLVKFKRK